MTATKSKSKAKASAYAHRIGRRKRATARVFLHDGTGQITVNGRTLEEYFPREALCMVVRQPLKLLKKHNTVDIKATAKGGGMKGQADAIKLAISRALIAQEEGDKRKTAEEVAACTPNEPGSARDELKRAGHLTRDARVVERKKTGQPGARRKKQFSKR